MLDIMLLGLQCATQLLVHTYLKLLFRCECPEGYEGTTCTEKIDYCTNSPCHNDGQCVSLDKTFKCNCGKSYSGQLCEVKLDNNYVVHFPRSGTTDFVQVDGFEGDLTEVGIVV